MAKLSEVLFDVIDTRDLPANMLDLRPFSRAPHVYADAAGGFHAHALISMQPHPNNLAGLGCKRRHGCVAESEAVWSSTEPRL